MKMLIIKTLAATLVLSAAAMNANAGCPSKMCGYDAYRTYYLDNTTCRYYYIDGMGNKVVGARYDRDALRYSGMSMKQDCNGRWYYQDAWGNRVYKSRHCS